MSLGTILKDARERKGLTVADVAEQTHLLPQMVEEIEQDDFHRFAAAIYGRGFIRLYAECVGENPEPLVREFSEIYSGARRPVIATRPVKTAQEDVNLVESSVFPSGRPRIRTRVVETAPEESDEGARGPAAPGDPVRDPVLDSPGDAGGAPDPAEDRGPAEPSGADAGAPAGDLFHQADVPGRRSPASPPAGESAARPFRPSRPGKRPGGKDKSPVPFDPFVDEPSGNAIDDDDDDAPRLFVWLRGAGDSLRALSPRALVGGSVAGLAVLLLVVILVAKPFSPGKSGKQAEPAAAGAAPAEFNGRPSPFSVSLLPPPDSYVR